MILPGSCARFQAELCACRSSSASIFQGRGVAVFISASEVDATSIGTRIGIRIGFVISNEPD